MEVKNKKDHNNSPKRQQNIILISAILIIVGILALLKNTGILDHNTFRIIVSWQMFLIVWGIWTFINSKHMNGIILAGIGIFFLIPQITGSGHDWLRIYWPIVLIIIGIIFLFKLKNPFGLFKHKNRFFESQNFGSGDGYVISDNTFNSVHHIVLDPVFKGASIDNTFGGTILDLRRTSLEAPETYIDIDCTFGGIEIYVPENWNIIQNIDLNLSGVEDKRIISSTNQDKEHKLIIQGDFVFSGLKIKN